MVASSIFSEAEVRRMERTDKRLSKTKRGANKPSRATRRMLLKTCQDSTIKQYSWTWKRLHKAGYPITPHGLINFIADNVDKVKAWAPRTLNVMRWAVVKWAEVRGLTVSQRKMDFMASGIDGYVGATVDNREPTKTRGAFTIEMLNQLEDIADEVGLTENEVLGLHLQWAFALRGGEVSKITWKNIRHVRGTTWLTLKRRKCGKRGTRGKSARQLVEAHRCFKGMETWLDVARARRIGLDNKDGALFPWWNTVDMNKKLKKAARAAGWSTQWAWSLHGMRFGCAYSVAQKYRAKGWGWGDIAEKVREHTGHLQDEMGWFYALQPELRNELRQDDRDRRSKARHKLRNARREIREKKLKRRAKKGASRRAGKRKH